MCGERLTAGLCFHTAVVALPATRSWILRDCGTSGTLGSFLHSKVVAGECSTYMLLKTSDKGRDRTRWGKPPASLAFFELRSALYYSCLSQKGLLSVDRAWALWLIMPHVICSEERWMSVMLEWHGKALKDADCITQKWLVRQNGCCVCFSMPRTHIHT